MDVNEGKSNEASNRETNRGSRKELIQRSEQGTSAEKLEKGRVDNDAGDLVRVNVGSGPPVLKVTEALVGDVSRDSNAGASVGNTPRELADVAGLVLARESLVVVFSVNGDVFDCVGKDSKGARNDDERQIATEYTQRWGK